MKLKARSSIYVPDFIGLLVAFTYLVWSLRGKRYHKSFLYAVWFSFILFFDFMVNIIGKWLQGGLFVYNLCIIQDLFQLCKGYLFFQINVSGLDRILYIFRTLELKDKITKWNGLLSFMFFAFVGIFFGYAEFTIFGKEHTTMLIKPYTYSYSNLSIERISCFVNALFYVMAFVIAFEIFVRLKKQNLLFLAGSAIYLLLSISQNFVNEDYFDFGTPLFESVGLYFTLWGLSSITKREEYIMMIYD